MTRRAPPLPWLEPGEPFPDPAQAWDAKAPAPGLLAAGGALDTETLVRAYQRGIFPWFSDGQPILWWSTDPRMVLPTQEFRLHRSLRKTLQRFIADPRCELRVDHDFDATIAACAASPRAGQSGTWIVADMIEAYSALHRAGHAHSVETWVDGRLVGGLYCVGVGRAIFGESMFALQPDASKIALAGLVALARAQGVGLIDCQQETAHLASLGARAIPRSQFLQVLEGTTGTESLSWRFHSVYWSELLDRSPPA